MKNRNVIKPGSYLITTYDKNSHTSSTLINSTTDWRESLVIDFDRVGPKPEILTTNRHQFTKLFYANYRGWTNTESSSTRTTYLGTGVQTFNASNPMAGRSWTNLYNSALSDLYDQLRYSGAGDGLDLSVSLAEASQVKKMLRQTARVVSYIRSFHPKQWGNKWLEYQYGWKPLISDVYGTAEAIMHRRLYTYSRIEAKSKDRFGGTVAIRNGRWPGSEERIRTSASYRCKLVAEFSLDNSVVQQLAGFSSLNPASILWELTPYSFVVDWFIDVGGYLQNLESALLYKNAFRKGYVVYGYKHIEEGYVNGGGFSSGRTYSGELKDGYRYQAFKNRQPLTTYPLPYLPRFEAKLGWKRLLSAASLLGQHLRK